LNHFFFGAGAFGAGAFGAGAFGAGCFGAGALAFITSWQRPYTQELWNRDTSLWIGPASALAAVVGAVGLPEAAADHEEETDSAR